MKIFSVIFCQVRAAEDGRTVMPARRLSLHQVLVKHAFLLPSLFSYTNSLRKHSWHLLNHVALVLEKHWRSLFTYELWFSMQCWIIGMLSSVKRVRNVQHLYVCSGFIALCSLSPFCFLWSTLRVYNDGNLWPLLAGCCCRISEWERSSTGSGSNQTPPGGRAGQKQWQWALVRRDSTLTFLCLVLKLCRMCTTFLL